MARINNPFVVTGKIEAEFFCDRVVESARVYLLGRTIYDTLLPRSRKIASLFIQTIKSINGKFGFDPITNMPTFNLELSDIERPEYSLDEIFRYLAEADKPCIMAIDEFQ